MTSSRQSTLTIRAPQMAVFAAALNSRLHGRVTERVLTDYPDYPWGTRADAEGFVGLGIYEAQQHKILGEQGIGDFIGLMVLLGTAFHRHPKIRPLLSDPEVVPSRRPATIYRSLAVADWNEISTWCTEHGS